MLVELILGLEDGFLLLDFRFLLGFAHDLHGDFIGAGNAGLAHTPRDDPAENCEDRGHDGHDQSQFPKRDLHLALPGPCDDQTRL